MIRFFKPSKIQSRYILYRLPNSFTNCVSVNTSDSKHSSSTKQEKNKTMKSRFKPTVCKLQCGCYAVKSILIKLFGSTVEE